MDVSEMTPDEALTELEAALESDFLRALGEPARVKVMRILIAQGASDVSEIAEQLPQERSVISRHLKALKDAGLVRMERKGRRRVYQLVPAAFIGRLEQILASARRCISVCCPEELE